MVHPLVLVSGPDAAPPAVSAILCAVTFRSRVPRMVDRVAAFLLRVPEPKRSVNVRRATFRVTAPWPFVSQCITSPSTRTIGPSDFRPTWSAFARRPTAGRPSRRTPPGHAERPLHQLAAGPVRELPGEVRLPEADRQASHRGEPRRGSRHREPVRLLPRGLRREVSGPLRRRSAPRARPYFEVAPTGALFQSLPDAARDSIARLGRRTVDVLVELNQLVQRSLKYDIRMEPGVLRRTKTLERKHGSRRDPGAGCSSILLRKLGIAARFVSGYSIQLVPDQKSLEGPKGGRSGHRGPPRLGRSLHPRGGWIGLDATSGLCAARVTSRSRPARSRHLLPRSAGASIGTRTERTTSSRRSSPSTWR